MKLVPLKELFHIQYGNQFDLNKMDISENSEINFISRSSQNMWIVAKVEEYNNKKPFEPWLITVTLWGSYLLSSFVQQKPFYTAQNIKILKPKREMSDIEKLYYCFCIKANRFKYTSHGREANSTLDELLVPESMPKERQSLKIERLNTLNKKAIVNENYELVVWSWEAFSLSELFDITWSKTTSIIELVEDYWIWKYPFITTQATNNGVEWFYDYWTEKGNSLTIDSAVLWYCSYQPLNFSASDHVEKLTPKFLMDKYIALFLTTILNKEQYRYNYWRKASQTRLKERSIKLPSRDWQPDWDFMRNFIKSLPYSASL